MAKDITLGNPNGSSGCSNFVRGADNDVSFDDTGAHGVMTSVIERKGSNPFDASHGSNLYKLRSLSTRTPSEAEAEALDATQSLEDSSEIQQVDAVASTDTSTGRLYLDVSWKSGTGENQTSTTEV
ncbi:MAG: hypothetical protein ABI445_00780 [Polyangia bacterium]